MSQNSNAPLGITTKSASLSASIGDQDRILELYWLQSLARELLPDHRVCICCRHLSHNANEVKIVYRHHRRKASFKGLARCASVWVCPVCGSVISEKRKSELKKASAAWKHSIIMVSYTIRHKRTDKLEDLLRGLEAAFRNFLSGSYGEDFRREYGVIGSVRALEVTHGKNGWHPHIHQMVFCGDLNAVDVFSEE